MYKLLGDMVYIYNERLIPTLHGYLNQGETIEQYLTKHKIDFVGGE